MSLVNLFLRIMGKEKRGDENGVCGIGKKDFYILHTQCFLAEPQDEYIGQPYVDMLQELLVQISGHIQSLTLERRISAPHDLEDRMVEILADIESYYRSLGNRESFDPALSYGQGNGKNH